MVKTESAITQHIVITSANVHSHAIVEIVVGAGKYLVYDIDQHLDGASDTGQIARTITYRFVCKRNSRLKLNIVLTGQITVINRIVIILQEEGAQATILGCCALNGLADQTIELVQEHQAPRTTSYSLIHCALTDQAVVKYDGMITIGAQANGTDAALYNKNLLLSNAARAIAVPSLEVHTNNVHCKHGTATSTCDQEQLFYMQSRGLDAITARELLLRGFFSQGFGLKQDQLKKVMHHVLKRT